MASLIPPIVALAIIIVSAALSPLHRRSRNPVTRPHRGLEMKASGGRLVYVRETSSEREI